MKQLKFNYWVSTYTRKKLSEKIGVSVWSIGMYVKGRQTPRLEIAKKIVSLSGGSFSLEELLHECSRAKV